MVRKESKRVYEAPLAELLHRSIPINLLVSLSVEAGIEDWEEGEEL